MKFSIVVPVYNVEKYLCKCVDSILFQTYKDFEIILVDDGSRDSSGKICDEYASKNPRIRVVHKVNGGLGYARNDGIKNASGDYMIFIDSDDYYSTNKALEIIAQRLSDYESDVILFNTEHLIDSKKIRMNTPYDLQYIRDNRNSADKIFRYLLEGDKIIACSWNKCLKRKFIIENELYFEKYIAGEDIEWMTKIFNSHPIFDAVNDCLHIYRRQRADSITATVSVSKVLCLFEIIKKIYSEINYYNEAIRENILSFLAFEYAILLMNYRVLSKADKNEVRKYKFLLDYAIDSKSKKVKKLYKVFGFSITAKAMELYSKRK